MEDTTQLSENTTENIDVSETESDDDSDYYGVDDNYFTDEVLCELDPPNEIIQAKSNKFEMLEEVPSDHAYNRNQYTPVDSLVFAGAMQSERTMMIRDLPEGVFVKMFENRLDLASVMILGPPSTPYEGCLFFFDVQVSKDYPLSPPKLKFLSYSTHKLNPNLYTTGLVCLSLLGTWSGNKNETWLPKQSSLLQIFVSIQGLILVAEPYYNEPSYHNRRGYHTKESMEYNANTLLYVTESMLNQIEKTPTCFRERALEYYRTTGLETYERLTNYAKAVLKAPFPLRIRNDGVLLNNLEKFKNAVMKLIESDSKNVTK